MNITEDEAKTKWCPQYQVATSGGDTSNTYEMDNRPIKWTPEGVGPDGRQKYRNDGIHPSACCLGSGCMWWRWDSDQPAGIAYSEYGTPEDVRAWGFCGKAGIP